MNRIEYLKYAVCGFAALCAVYMSTSAAVPAYITITADDAYELYVNGILIGGSGGWETPETWNVELDPGKVVVAVAVRDNSEASYSGIGMIAKVELEDGTTTLVTDKSWKVSDVVPSDWTSTNYDDSSWDEPLDEGPYDSQPWVLFAPPLSDFASSGSRWLWRGNPSYSPDYGFYNSGGFQYCFFRKTFAIASPSGAFSTFSPSIEIKFDPKRAGDSFQTTATFELNTKSNGIDPRNENVTLKFGTFSATIPAGSFQTYRQNKVPDKVRFDGVVENVKLVVDIYSYGSNRYLLWAKGYGAKLDGTSVPVRMSLRIGDDSGDANLTVGSAEFKKVVVRPDGATCASIKAAKPAARDGVYTIDPDGSGGNEPVEVYCDMATAGGGWEVLFRGDDPGKWATTFGTPGSGQWGIDKTGLPSSISELRFSRVDTGEALSIPIAASDVYGCAPAGSNYFWNGTSYQNFSARHLGVSDTVPLTGPPEFEGYVITGESCNNDHHSWGFGHRGWIDDRQAWGWDSQDLGPTVFQIQVR